MFTYRRGPRVRTGSDDATACGGILSLLMLVLLLVGAPVMVYWMEAAHIQRVSTLGKMLEVKFADLRAPETQEELTLHHGKNPTPVWVTSSEIEALARDGEFGVDVAGALALERETSYCQWTEHAHRRCETCTREVRAQDGSTSTESYGCDCVVEYSYIKGWSSYRVPSMLFAQPAAHFNPQRDPYPSKRFAAKEARLKVTPESQSESESESKEEEEEDNGGRRRGRRRRKHKRDKMKLTAVLDGELVSRARAAWRPVRWTVGGVAPEPSSSRWRRVLGSFRLNGGGEGSTRYEAVSPLLASRSTRLTNSEADGFAYVGDGVFYSAYEATLAERLAKAFFQYAEGSLFDWQIGDLLPTCTPGDIKLTYRVQDPSSLSALGVVVSTSSDVSSIITEEEEDVVVRLGDGDDVSALVHSGSADPPAMIRTELRDASVAIAWGRFLLFLWGVPMACLSFAALGRDLWRAGVVATVSGAAGVFVVVELAFLLALWPAARNAGYTTASYYSRLTVALGTALAGLAALALATTLSVPARAAPGLRAAWCMLARAAGLPPAWRVEAAYRGRPSKDASPSHHVPPPPASSSFFSSSRHKRET